MLNFLIAATDLGGLSLLLTRYTYRNGMYARYTGMGNFTTGREIIVLLLPALIIIIRGITRVLAVFGILCDGRMIE